MHESRSLRSEISNLKSPSLLASAPTAPRRLASPPDDPSSDVAAQIARTQAALYQYTTDDMDYAVPAAAVPLLTTLKHQLRDLVIAELNSSEKNAVTPDDLEARVLLKLESHGVQAQHPGSTAASDSAKDEHPYGRIQEISVRQPTSDPDLLAITTTLRPALRNR